MEAFRARQTLFALLSSIEDDLRTPIIEYFSSHPSETILDAKLLEKCANRKAHANGNSDNTSLQELIVFSDLGDLTGVLNANKAFLPEDLSKYVKGIRPVLPVVKETLAA